MQLKHELKNGQLHFTSVEMFYAIQTKIKEWSVQFYICRNFSWMLKLFKNGCKIQTAAWLSTENMKLQKMGLLKAF